MWLSCIYNPVTRVNVGNALFYKPREFPYVATLSVFRFNFLFYVVTKLRLALGHKPHLVRDRKRSRSGLKYLFWFAHAAVFPSGNQNSTIIFHKNTLKTLFCRQIFPGQWPLQGKCEWIKLHPYFSLILSFFSGAADQPAAAGFACSGQDALERQQWGNMQLYTYVASVWRCAGQLSPERHHTDGQQQRPSAHAL